MNIFYYYYYYFNDLFFIFFYKSILQELLNLSKLLNNEYVPGPGLVLWVLVKSYFHPFPKVVLLNLLLVSKVYRGVYVLQGGELLLS